VHVLNSGTLTIALEIHNQAMTVPDNLMFSLTITNNNRRYDRSWHSPDVTAVPVVEKGA
jgi:hypothetical protein